MCGFAALIEPGRQFAPDLLDAMERDLHHRGPDSGGRTGEPGLALVFRRLAILDPAASSDQPMTDDSGRFTIVFNGEIYNYKALRDELAEQGVRFKSRGDTEVLIHGYAAWGEGLLERLEGMYAFVLIDRRERKAIAARDPFGIKPLYMLRKGAMTAFASTLRPLSRLTQAEPDEAALAELLTFRFAAGRMSNLKGIEKVPGGTVVTVSLDSGTARERRFCDILSTLQPEAAMTEQEAEAEALAEIEASVRAHLQSDVGYTVQLSGGVDSSLVTALAAPATEGRLTTFGINLSPDPYDEAPYRRMVIERYAVDHHEVAMSAGDYAAALPRAIAHMEGPTAHSGCVLLMLLCDRIRKTSKVVLTGEGADEFFGGYKRYGLWRQLRNKGWMARAVPPFLWPYLQRYREIERYSGRDPAIYSSVYHDIKALNEVFPALVPKPGGREEAASRFRHFRDRMFAVDQTAYLESLLLRQDKMAMAASVEARVPFTHLPLARIVNRIPHRIRAPGGETKPLLKRIAGRYLPRELVYRRKVGLVVPLNEWLADPSALGRYLELLTEPNSRLAAFADRAKLRNAVESFRAGQRRNLPPLEHFVNMELWLRSLPAYASHSALAA
jgi:asparagine synthase (glutamine-hydrolysing)